MSHSFVFQLQESNVFIGLYYCKLAFICYLFNFYIDKVAIQGRTYNMECCK